MWLNEADSVLGRDQTLDRAFETEGQHVTKLRVFSASLDSDEVSHILAVEAPSGCLEAVVEGPNTLSVVPAEQVVAQYSAASSLGGLESRARLLTSNYVVVETSALTRSRLGTEAFRAFTEQLLPVAQIEWVTEQQHAAATSAALLVGNAGPSLVDCTSFEVMRALGIRTAFAHDRHFSQAGFESAMAG